MTARGGRLFSQFAFTIQIFRELLPLRGPTDAVGLHGLIVDELWGIAVLEIVAVVDDLPIFDTPLTEHKVKEYLAADEADVCGSTFEQKFSVQIEVDAACWA